MVHNNVKVSELMEYWLEYDIKERAGSYGTYATFRSIVLNHVNPAIGKKKMNELNRGNIQKLYNDVVAYSDIDYINHTLSVERQLGRKLHSNKEDFAPKTFTKQEVKLKTKSSKRVIPIPDLVFEEILKEFQR